MNMEETKVIVNYLPQYHEIPENNKWWGKGYTDWVATKNAKPQFDGHKQPKVPSKENYYDLSNPESIRWQIEIAKKHGIYGFGIYHYWFSSKLNLLQKPAEIILNDCTLDIHFLFIWDNASWKRTWSNVRGANDWAPLYEENKATQDDNNGILAELDYGNEKEWKDHFMYLLPFFKDKRYIKSTDGKPLFMFFNMDKDSETLIKMSNYWKKMAVENGLPGIVFLGKVNYHKVSIFDFDVDYEPGQHGWAFNSYIGKVFSKLKFETEKRREVPHFIDYDKIWKRIIWHAKKNKDDKRLYSAFVNYDDSPRRGKNGRICRGATPKKFEYYMTEILRISRQKNKDYIFLTAWNEWGEGAYLEPDEISGDEYLKSLKNAIIEAKR